MALTWSEVAVPTTGSSSVNVRDWVYDTGHGVLVGVGDAGLVYTTDDPTDAGSWVKRTAPAANDYSSVAYAPTLGTAGRLCAVSKGGTDRVMISDDGGQTWAAQTAAENNVWNTVKWIPWANGGAGWFCAVSSTGTNRAMTSPTGLTGTWTARAAAAATTWTGLADSGSVLVAINASSGTSRAMTSTDGGATWMIQTTPAGLSSSTGGVPAGSNYVQWSSVAACFAWAAVVSASSARCMVTSPDGLTWAIQTIPDSTRSHGGLIPFTGGLLHFRQNAGGYTNLVNTSDDGTTWAVEDPGFYRLWGAGGFTDAGAVVAWADGSSTAVLVGFEPPTVTRVIASRGRTTGGKLVRITGTGFTGTPAVTFDGVAATNVTVMSATLITARTPAHAAGLADVDVNGVTLADAYLYTDSLFGDLTIRYEQGIFVEDALNDAPNSARMRCTRVGSPETPNLGFPTLLIDPASGATLFGGTALVTIDGIDGKPSNPGYRDLAAGDLTWRLNAKRPFGVWLTQDADLIVQDLLDLFAPDFTGIIEAGLPQTSITLNRSETLSQALSRLAQQIGGAWYPDDNFGVHFFLTNPADPPDPITDETALYDPLPTVTRDLTQVRNRIFVKGAGSADSYEPAVSQIEGGYNVTMTSTTGGSIPDSFQYGYYLTYVTASGHTYPRPLSSNNQSQVQVQPGDDAVSLTNLDVSVSPDPRVTGRAIWRTKSTGTWYNALDAYLVTTLGNSAGTGDDTFLDGVADSSLTQRAPGIDSSGTVFAMREDVAAQAYLAALLNVDGGNDDGVRDGYISAPSLLTQADAEARGDAELALFAYPIETVVVAGRDEKLVSGQTVSITLSNPAVSGSFKIQHVAIDQIAIDAAGLLFARRTITASSVRFTLDDLLRQVALGSG